MTRETTASAWTSGRPGGAGLLWGTAAVLSLCAYLALLVAANSFVAGGADSSGYANAARLFARGRVSETIEIFRELSLPSLDGQVFIPLGLRPGARPGTMAPTYPPGLPLHMAAAAAVGGWSAAPFLIPPLCAVAAVALLFFIARELGLSRRLSAAGALLLAASPIFFGMAIQPMSDAVATAWVLAAVLLGLRARRDTSAAFVAGAALGVAVLVRPTNALAAIPLALALPPRKKAFLGALIGAIPLAAFLFLYDVAAFGRAAETGYGAMLTWTMSFSNLLPEIRHYGHWVPALLTPLLPLAWLLLPLDRRVARRDRALLFAWFAAFLGFYLFYEPYEDWWSVRFLLPGIPALILAALLIGRDIRWPRTPRTRAATGLAFLTVAIALDVRHALRLDLFAMKKGEAIYRDASLWADRAVPPESLLVSMQMSGALKYYTGRSIARWDVLGPASFSRIRHAAEERGFRWYALLRGFEEPGFARSVPGNWTRLGSLRDVGLWRLD